MVVAVIAGLVGLVTVVVAFYRQDALLDPPRDPEPDWGPLPTPNDVARPTFPVAFPGYDPAAVDATLEALVIAYEELWTAAGPDARERARRAASRRRGGDAPAPLPPAEAVAAQPAVPAAHALAHPVPGRGHVPEALRAAAALAILRRAQQRR
jgi:DivIVA domain-containing protein